jgi:iron complex transport system permease protein
MAEAALQRMRTGPGRAAAATSIIFVTLAAAAGALSWGSVAIPVPEILRIIGNAFSGQIQSDPARAAIILDIRLPRVILAALTGASLASAGAVYQAVFRNPLADPYLIGVSSGASLGAALAILFVWRFSWGGLSAVSVSAFVFALGTTFAAYGVARVGARTSTTRLILAGVALSALLSAATTFLMLTAPSAFQTVQVLGWIMGSFSLASWSEVVSILPYLLAGGIVISLFAYRLNVLQLGEEQAHVLGIPVEASRVLLVGAASLVTAAAVSVSGVIGFVGLVVPHIVRIIWGPDHRFLLPVSALVGALLLVLADAAARTLIAPAEIPIGVVTACIGVPFFLYLLRRRRSEVG